MRELCLYQSAVRFGFGRKVPERFQPWSMKWRVHRYHSIAQPFE